MLDLPQLPKTTIQAFDTVPSFPGRALISLPRCGKCYEMTHDYRDGKASCILTPGQYSAMDDKTLTDWHFAEACDRQTKPLEA
ncbi:hypothetical protein DYQ86_16110 [Acidobacteria bacterium AB60]|nr:hypothetical protein DYQ86_16110 [Acidobacteria bacterium AB60]